MRIQHARVRLAIPTDVSGVVPVTAALSEGLHLFVGLLQVRCISSARMAGSSLNLWRTTLSTAAAAKNMLSSIKY